MTALSVFDKVEQAVVEVSGRVRCLGSPPSWSGLGESELWYELAACILGSNVRFEMAQSFAHQLRAREVLALPIRDTTALSRM